MIEEMYRVHNKSIIIYIKIITGVIFIQIWHRWYGYTAKSLCHDRLVALAFGFQIFYLGDIWYIDATQI